MLERKGNLANPHGVDGRGDEPGGAGVDVLVGALHLVGRATSLVGVGNTPALGNAGTGVLGSPSCW